jgi:hypothetical protein
MMAKISAEGPACMLNMRAQARAVRKVASAR